VRLHVGTEILRLPKVSATASLLNEKDVVTPFLVPMPGKRAANSEASMTAEPGLMSLSPACLLTCRARCRARCRAKRESERDDWDPSSYGVVCGTERVWEGQSIVCAVGA
jgi:hypothetical protein